MNEFERLQRIEAILLAILRLMQYGKAIQDEVHASTEGIEGIEGIAISIVDGTYEGPHLGRIMAEVAKHRLSQ